MTLYKIKFLCITLILIIGGCIEKDELTLPVRIHLKIGITSLDSSNSEYFYFPRGQIGVQSIRFEGKREAGGDVFFETDPKMNLQKIKFGLDPVIISEFDIPKGIYYYMKWDITLKRIDWNEGFNDDDYADSLNIGLSFSGFYDYLNEYDIPINFNIDDTVRFNFMSYDRYGNSRIFLFENKYEAILFLDPIYGFSPITRSSIREAENSLYKNRYPRIIISSNKNKYLYENLLSRISGKAKALIY